MIFPKVPKINIFQYSRILNLKTLFKIRFILISRERLTVATLKYFFASNGANLV
jgi:hypothetical protein